MVYKHSTVVEAYTVLGLDQDASLEVVKSTYRQLALKTHPDKNPGDADATAQFQRISEAYNTLVKHLDRSEAPSHSHSHSHFHTHSHSHGHSHAFYHPFGFEEDDYDDDDYYYDDDEFDDYDYDSEYEESMDFYRFLFEELLRGRASRFAQSQYHRTHHHPGTPTESPEQYNERLRRTREEQERAAERRTREEAYRKANQEKERERERREAEERQRVKKTAKKAKAEASRKSAEQKVQAQQQQQQVRRSNVFAAARRDDAAAVKKGIYEENVDASGGEFRKESEGSAKNAPADPKETLLHIAAKNGDIELVEWLDSHGADAEERNGEDLTAFHVALLGGHAPIVNHFFESYPPKDEDYAAVYRAPESRSNFQIALDSKEPEMVWTIFDKHLYTKEEMDQAWDVVNSEAFKSSISPASKHKEIVFLFLSLGKYLTPPEPESPPTPPPQTTDRRQTRKSSQPRRPRPTVTVEEERSHTTSPVSAASEHVQTPLPASPSTKSPRPFRGQHNRRGSRRPYNNQQQPSSPAGSFSQDGQQQSSNHGGRGRGRGRGQFRAPGRGRGRGDAPVAA